VGKKLQLLGKSIQAANADVGRYSGETFRNIKVVRAYNKEKTEHQNFTGLVDVAVKHILGTARIELGVGNLVEALAFSGFAVLLWSAGNDIYTGSMTIGQLVSFAYFALFIVRSAGSFISVANRVNVAIGTASKVVEYLAIETHTWPSSVTDFTSQGGIEFSYINFSYPSRPDITVLDNINIKIPSGAHVALVGSSGAGKSTLFELLLRFYELEQGNILLDGEDNKNIDVKQLRAAIGYVPQKESLITGSVFDNISYGIDDADEATVTAAAKMAHADEFIQKLPLGYETDLGEVGNKLSGGQKQRISLARALIRNPQILLLDEAKSALDASSERIVSEAIEAWAAKRKATVITIAHSLATVQHADLIVVMDNGKIVGQGKHEELLQSCALYQKLSFVEPQNTDNS
jgi:ATP-binding cassette subfamily B protein